VRFRLSFGFGHGDSFQEVFDFAAGAAADCAVKKWGQAPASASEFKRSSLDRRSRSPFFMIADVVADPIQTARAETHDAVADRSRKLAHRMAAVNVREK
jgi:hypothetical protein